MILAWVRKADMTMRSQRLETPNTLTGILLGNASRMHTYVLPFLTTTTTLEDNLSDMISQTATASVEQESTCGM